MPAFQESARDEMIFPVSSVNPPMAAPNTSASSRESMNVPEKMPMKREMTTFLVIKARVMAIRGGTRVSTPNLSALAWTAAGSAAKRTPGKARQNIAAAMNTGSE